MFPEEEKNQGDGMAGSERQVLGAASGTAKKTKRPIGKMSTSASQKSFGVAKKTKASAHIKQSNRMQSTQSKDKPPKMPLRRR